jgi:NitT/TauT family transport system ATP-binding protein
MTEAIRDISFNAGVGEFLSIVGPSGCGKTTLLKIVAGLLNPSKGEIRVFGTSVKKPIRDMGIVFQSSLLMPWRNASENVLLPIELLRMEKKSFTVRAAQLLALVGLRGFELRYPRELSMGMQQRVAIARALIHDPQLLLLDEPFGSLDELTREQMGMELIKITEAMGKTVVLVTHSIPEAVLLADRLIVLSERPSVLRMDLKIDLDRPRTKAVRVSERYVNYCEQVREAFGIS